ncbi:hypothetical protein BTVI_09625 [Pitangus sulphuratus]|nr:hypothetical protein BTVI_09625 [Pitangus sulphuratus]
MDSAYDMKSSCKPVTSGVPWGSILGPIFFNIFINELDDEAECTFSKFVNDTQQRSDQYNRSKAAGQRALDSLEKWSERNIIKCNKGITKSCPWRGTITIGDSLTGKQLFGKGPRGPSGLGLCLGCYLCAKPWLVTVLQVPHCSYTMAVGTPEDSQPIPLPSLDTSFSK